MKARIEKAVVVLIDEETKAALISRAKENDRAISREAARIIKDAVKEFHRPKTSDKK